MNDPNEEGRRFRFRRSTIERIMGDQEMILRQAEARVEEAERRVQELELALEEARAGERPARSASRTRSRDRGRRRRSGAAGFDHGGDLAAIVARMQRAVRAIADSGKLGEPDAGRPLSDLQAQVVRLVEWHDQIEPLMGSLRDRLAEVRISIEELPRRVQEALAPLASGLRKAEIDVARFEGAVDASPPTASTGGPRGPKGRASGGRARGRKSR